MIETRGVWLTDTDSKVLRCKQSIAAMEFLALTGFNVVFPVVWNKAVTLYPSQVMSSIFDVEIARNTKVETLAELIGEAHSLASKLSPGLNTDLPVPTI